MQQVVAHLGPDGQKSGDLEFRVGLGSTSCLRQQLSPGGVIWLEMFDGGTHLSGFTGTYGFHRREPRRRIFDPSND